MIRSLWQRGSHERFARRWSRRMIVIVGAAVAAVLAGVTGSITAITTNLIGSAQSKVREALAPAQPDLAVKAQAEGDPYIEGVAYDYSAVFPVVYTPSREELALMQDILGPDSNRGPDNAAMLQKSFINKGAAYLNRMLITLQVRNQTKGDVRIVNVRTMQRKRAKPYNGTLMFIPLQGEGSTQQMTLNVDKAAPVAQDPETGKPFFDSTVVTLRPGEEETFKILAEAEQVSAQFEIKLDYRLGGKEGSTIVTNEGKPFVLSAYNCVALNTAKYNKPYELGNGPRNSGKYGVYQNHANVIMSTRVKECPKSNQ